MHISHSAPQKTSQISTIQVYYNGGNEQRLVGQLTQDGRKPVFGYDPAWITDGLPLSPLSMPHNMTRNVGSLNTHNHRSRTQASAAPSLFYGEHANAHYVCGLLADSLPDGWGMLLMDRFFQKHFDKPRHDISVLERFAYIGRSDRVIGALSFQPEQQQHSDMLELDMLAMASANEQILAGQDTDILQELLIIGGSAQGARPKSLLYYDPVTDFITTQAHESQLQPSRQPSLQPWLIKFPAHNEHKSVCLLEALYATYAKQAGLVMPDHHYFDIGDKYSAFGVQRFDRVLQADNKPTQRVHIHTLAGLLDIDFRVPSIDYMQFLRCVRRMTASQQQVEQAYRQVVFNVVFNNKDDHSKNFSFLMDERGIWSLSPVYDVTYNTGMNGYHQMDVCGEAKHPSYKHLIMLAKRADIKTTVAQRIIAEVVTSAQAMLKDLVHYAIESTLSRQVLHDVQANIERMQST